MRFSGRATTASGAVVDERHADSGPLQTLELSANDLQTNRKLMPLNFSPGK